MRPKRAQQNDWIEVEDSPHVDKGNDEQEESRQNDQEACETVLDDGAGAESEQFDQYQEMEMSEAKSEVPSAVEHQETETQLSQEPPQPAYTNFQKPMEFEMEPEPNNNATSATAKEFVKQFQEAIDRKDGASLSELLFDAELEDENISEEIDIGWYEKMAAKLTQ